MNQERINFNFYYMNIGGVFIRLLEGLTSDLLMDELRSVNVYISKELIVFMK